MQHIRRWIYIGCQSPVRCTTVDAFIKSMHRCSVVFFRSGKHLPFVVFVIPIDAQQFASFLNTIDARKGCLILDTRRGYGIQAARLTLSFSGAFTLASRSTRRSCLQVCDQKLRYINLQCLKYINYSRYRPP